MTPVPSAAHQITRRCRPAGKDRIQGVQKSTKSTVPAASEAPIPTIICVIASGVVVNAPSTMPQKPVTTTPMIAVSFGFIMRLVMRPNDAGQWRAATSVQMQTEAQSAPPLHQPG